MRVESETRRLAERDQHFVEGFHLGWQNLPGKKLSIVPVDMPRLLTDRGHPDTAQHAHRYSRRFYPAPSCQEPFRPHRGKYNILVNTNDEVAYCPVKAVVEGFARSLEATLRKNLEV